MLGVRALMKDSPYTRKHGLNRLGGGEGKLRHKRDTFPFKAMGLGTAPANKVGVTPYLRGLGAECQCDTGAQRSVCGAHLCPLKQALSFTMAVGSVLFSSQGLRG